MLVTADKVKLHNVLKSKCVKANIQKKSLLTSGLSTSDLVTCEWPFHLTNAV